MWSSESTTSYWKSCKAEDKSDKIATLYSKKKVGKLAARLQKVLFILHWFILIETLFKLL